MRAPGSALEVGRDDVTTALRRFRRIDSGPLAVRCDCVRAIPFRDVVEAYLGLRGNRHSHWVDAGDRRLPCASPIRALANILRDLIAGPAHILRYYWRTRGLVRSGLAPVRWPGRDEPGRALYLRTDHWFNLTSGGSVGHVQGVIEGLRHHGILTEVISTDPLHGVPRDEHFHLCEPNYGAGRNIPGVPELAYNDIVIDCASRLCTEARPDFLYQRLSLFNLAGPVLRLRHSIPLVCEYNGSQIWAARNWSHRPVLLEDLATRMETAALRCSDLIVVVSEAIREDVVGRGIEESRVLVNPNGVDPSRYHPAVDGTEARRKLGLADRLVVGFIGTFSQWHGAEVLTRAFAGLCAGHPELRQSVRLLMIGDGPSRAGCEAMLREAGLGDRAVFTGRVPQGDGPRYLAACDILVSPHVPNPDGTAFFGSPTKLFEYLAMGRPVVASDLDQIAVVLSDEESALLIPPGDENALSEALHRLVESPKLRAELGAAGRRLAESKYSWGEHSRRILDALARRLQPT